MLCEASGSGESSCDSSDSELRELPDGPGLTWRSTIRELREYVTTKGLQVDVATRRGRRTNEEQKRIFNRIFYAATATHSSRSLCELKATYCASVLDDDSKVAIAEEQSLRESLRNATYTELAGLFGISFEAAFPIHQAIQRAIAEAKGVEQDGPSASPVLDDAFIDALDTPRLVSPASPALPEAPPLPLFFHTHTHTQTHTQTIGPNGRCVSWLQRVLMHFFCSRPTLSSPHLILSFSPHSIGSYREQNAYSQHKMYANAYAYVYVDGLSPLSRSIVGNRPRVCISRLT